MSHAGLHRGVNSTNTTSTPAAEPGTVQKSSGRMIFVEDFSDKRMTKTYEEFPIEPNYDFFFENTLNCDMLLAVCMAGLSLIAINLIGALIIEIKVGSRSWPMAQPDQILR
jgi:hypothetical protein